MEHFFISRVHFWELPQTFVFPFVRFIMEHLNLNRCEFIFENFMEHFNLNRCEFIFGDFMEHLNLNRCEFIFGNFMEHLNLNASSFLGTSWNI
jgi:hypothetical protein